VSSIPADLQATEERLKGQLRSLDVQLKSAQNQPGPETATRLRELWRQRQQAEDELNTFARGLAKTHPQYKALRFPEPCSLAEARAGLHPSEVALLFAVGNEASYVVVLSAQPDAEDRAEGLAIYRLPGRRLLQEKIEALTQKERLELPDGARDLGASLHQLLLAPLAERLRGKDLVIVADGPLCHLPFELLVEGATESDEGHYLLETHRIRYAPSLTALHMIGEWERGRKVLPERPLWALGDPVYSATDERLKGGDERQVAAASQEAFQEYVSRSGEGSTRAAGNQFARLRSSGAEVRAIRDTLKANEDAVLTDLSASEAAVKAASHKGWLAQARYVHFATHGILGLDVGKQPALVLSLVGTSGKQDEDGTDDGFLQLDEVSGLKLNADLVVLSACQSGQGRLHNGEGVSGLARVFLYAGSRGVVCSLWSVDDAATAELMQGLYRRLRDGQNAADALRAAKLDMLKDRRAPLYWAPFILMGK
jgi:CHAT domain-containing protein